MIRPALLLLVAGALVSCGGDRGSDPLILVGGGNFSYSAYGPAGTRVLEGTIHLAWPDASIDPIEGDPVTGTWEIHWVPGADTSLDVGPQVGSGTLEGIAGADGVLLQLNPEMTDNNVSLHARVHGYDLSGKWVWTSLQGPSTDGRFSAIAGR